MIVPDVNLLVYAYNSDAPEHRGARAWLENLLSGIEPVALAWVTILGFVRIMTSRRILIDPMTVPEATGHVRSWLERPQVRILHPGPTHLDLLEDLARHAGAAGEITTDLHLAALAIEHQAELHSNDSDFARMRGLRWRNPLR